MGLWSKGVERSQTGELRKEDKERHIHIDDDFYVVVEEERELIHVHRTDYRDYGIYVMDSKRPGFKWGEDMSIHDIEETCWDCVRNQKIMDSPMFKRLVIEKILENY